MEEPFSWQRFDSIAKVLGSLGYLAAVFGPLTGIAMLVLGSTAVRLAGIVVIGASVLIAAYHISFSLLMNAVHDITRHLELHEHEQVETPTAGHVVH
ncbi:MAG TPA: hypothetical protein VGL38_15010 [bacterium]|jgi:hypothetical protein